MDFAAIEHAVYVFCQKFMQIDDINRSSLDNVLMGGDPEMLAEYLQKHPRKIVANDNLHLAVVRNTRCVRILLESGRVANVNKRVHGFTPVGLAVCLNNPDTLSELIRFGGSATKLQNPWTVAYPYTDSTTPMVLANHMARHYIEWESPESKRELKRNLRCIGLLVAAGARIGYKEMHAAVQDNTVAAVKLMLTLGGSIDRRVFSDGSAFNAADTNMLEFLLGRFTPIPKRFTCFGMADLNLLLRYGVGGWMHVTVADSEDLIAEWRSGKHRLQRIREALNRVVLRCGLPVENVRDAGEYIYLSKYPNVV